MKEMRTTFAPSEHVLLMFIWSWAVSRAGAMASENLGDLSLGGDKALMY
jgi:hypothetical protein